MCPQSSLSIAPKSYQGRSRSAIPPSQNGLALMTLSHVQETDKRTCRKQVARRRARVQRMQSTTVLFSLPFSLFPFHFLDREFTPDLSELDDKSLQSESVKCLLFQIFLTNYVNYLLRNLAERFVNDCDSMPFPFFLKLFRERPPDGIYPFHSATMSETWS